MVVMIMSDYDNAEVECVHFQGKQLLDFYGGQLLKEKNLLFFAPLGANSFL